MFRRTGRRARSYSAPSYFSETNKVKGSKLVVEEAHVSLQYILGTPISAFFLLFRVQNEGAQILQ